MDADLFDMHQAEILWPTPQDDPADFEAHRFEPLDDEWDDEDAAERAAYMRWEEEQYAADLASRMADDAHLDAMMEDDGDFDLG